MDNTEKEANQNTSTPVADRVEVVVYTDPLCCWSYALEPHLQQLQRECEGTMDVRYCLGGMIPDWNHYYDDVNSVSKPVQMGALWMQVRELTGTYLYDRIWIDDPPASSYPACIAVKCAGLQSLEAGKEYLALLRVAAMTEGRNIAKNDTLLDLARKMPRDFNVDQFCKGLLSGAGKPAFRKDLEEVRKNQISRFPTITLKTQKAGIMINGFKKFDYLYEALLKVI